MKFLTRTINRLLSFFNLVVIKKSRYYYDDKYLEKAEFKYILWLDRLYSKIQNIPGHVVELGVAKGRNSIIFGNLIQMNGDELVRKYYGFDTFEGYTKESLAANNWLNSTDWRDTSKQFVEKRLATASLDRICSVFKGDLKKTLPVFIKQGAPGFQPNKLKIALLYVDCNAYDSAIAGMELLKDFIAPGGIVCIDEKQQGGETQALIDFCQKYGLKYTKDASAFSIPAYTVVNMQKQ